MREEPMTKFVACKRRNVAAAYKRFLGPSAVLPDAWHSRTWAGLLSLARVLRPRPTPRAGVSDTGGDYAVPQPPGSSLTFTRAIYLVPAMGEPIQYAVGNSSNLAILEPAELAP